MTAEITEIFIRQGTVYGEEQGLKLYIKTPRNKIGKYV